MLKMRHFLLCFFLFAVGSVYAQDFNRPVESFSLNNNTIVSNEKGKQYTYAAWHKLWLTGNYRLKPVNHESDSTAFILVKRDDAAENKKYAALPKPEESKFFKTGDQFRFRTFTDINGNIYKPADLAGKVVVVNFWFIACPICRYEMPELNRVVKNYEKNRDVVFIAITFDKKEAIERFLKIMPFDYHLIGDSLPLYSYYGVQECPVSLVVDKTGVIKFNCQGDGDGSAPYWITQNIEAALHN